MASPGRNLEYAVLASLALHGLLLFGVSTVKESATRRAVAPEPIAARLAEPEPVAPAPVVKSISNKSILKKSISESAPVPGPVPVEAAVAESKPLPVPAPAAPPLAIQVPAALSEPGVPRAEPVLRAEAADPPTDAATIGQYRVQLIGAARRFKRYPEAARENNWSGNVLVGVAVGADGRPQTSVRQSSGRPVLDQQALEMFQQAVRAVPVPRALRGKEFSLEVRAIYGLED